MSARARAHATVTVCRASEWIPSATRTRTAERLRAGRCELCMRGITLSEAAPLLGGVLLLGEYALTAGVRSRSERSDASVAERTSSRNEADTSCRASGTTDRDWGEPLLNIERNELDDDDDDLGRDKGGAYAARTDASSTRDMR